MCGSAASTELCGGLLARAVPTANAALEAAGRPVPLGELRVLCRVRHATLHERLRVLTSAGRLLHDAAGYRLAPPSVTASSPPSSQSPPGNI